MSCNFEVTILMYDISIAVTFSRIDPGGKLVMGFRKASISIDAQVDTIFILLSVVPYLDNISFSFFPCWRI